MPIHYAIRELQGLKGDIYTANVLRLDTVDIAHLVDRIVAHGSTVGRADILAVLEDYHTTIRELLMMGMSITTPIACYRPVIHGTFAGTGDSFDPARHQLTVSIRPSSLLKRAVAADCELTREIATRPCPVPAACQDLASDTANGALTPGEGIHLTGKKLRFDPKDPEQGVFFRAADGTVTRAEKYLEIRPSKLIAIVPALAAGIYKVEVRASSTATGRSGPEC